MQCCSCLLSIWCRQLLCKFLINCHLCRGSLLVIFTLCTAAGSSPAPGPLPRDHRRSRGGKMWRGGWETTLAHLKSQTNQPYIVYCFILFLDLVIRCRISHNKLSFQLTEAFTSNKPTHETGGSIQLYSFSSEFDVYVYIPTSNFPK